MRVVDENRTTADAQISIIQDEEMDMIICDKSSDVAYHPETKCMYPCTLSITCMYVGYSGIISQITELLRIKPVSNVPASVKILQN